MNPRKLPPLILHPFADSGGPDKLVESSRASLMIQGLLPSGERTSEELDRALLSGRYCEIRMLYYVGKDLMRWIEQCLEHVARHRELSAHSITYQSLANYLIHNSPQNVQTKLRKWGVADYRAIFTRALGLNAMWSDVPDADVLSEEFIRNYYRYADAAFGVRQGQGQATPVADLGFEFEIFASGEYSRMLEREWAEQPD